MNDSPLTPSALDDGCVSCHDSRYRLWPGSIAYCAPCEPFEGEPLGDDPSAIVRTPGAVDWSRYHRINAESSARSRLAE